jgi:hypothetical protein
MQVTPGQQAGKWFDETRATNLRNCDVERCVFVACRQSKRYLDCIMKNSMWCFLGLSSCAVLKSSQVALPIAGGPFVSHEIAFEVAMPRADFVAQFYASPLERFIQGTHDLPGVDHTEPLTEKRFPADGSVRLVVLKDGTSAHEEVLSGDVSHLRYRVTQYTSESAKPIDWALGEFTFSESGPAHTAVTWRYSFKLRESTFPGALGGLGRSLFRGLFMKPKYVPFMQAISAEIQRLAP